MTTANPLTPKVIAALLVIGDKILSGRTKDKNFGYIVSDSPITLFRWLDFFVGLSANASRPRDYAARRSAERCAAQPQGMSSSRRDAGQRLTSFVSTSAK